MNGRENATAAEAFLGIYAFKFIIGFSIADFNRFPFSRTYPG
jgi:hypothetical protein